MVSLLVIRRCLREIEVQKVLNQSRAIFGRSVALRGYVLHRTLLRRSAKRVCQPGPVAFQRSITSAGRRSEISLRGFGDKGLPPLFTFARASMSSVSSGSSSYSSGLTL